jgi:hypothetical protein
MHGTIVRAVLDNLDLGRLQSRSCPYSRPYLQSRSFGWDDHDNTFLTEACRSSEDWLIHYLLEHNTDLTLGWFHGGALHVALIALQSI